MVTAGEPEVAAAELPVPEEDVIAIIPTGAAADNPGGTVLTGSEGQVVVVVVVRLGAAADQEAEAGADLTPIAVIPAILPRPVPEAEAA